MQEMSDLDIYTQLAGTQAQATQATESHWVEEFILIPCKGLDVTHRGGKNDGRGGSQLF